MTAPARVAPAVREADFQRSVLDLAGHLGYLRAHFRPLRTKHGGWQTPVSGDGRGFPDLLLVGHGRVIAVELKARRGIVAPEQARWLEAFAASGCESYIWRWEGSKTYDQIAAVLTTKVGGRMSADAGGS